MIDGLGTNPLEEMINQGSTCNTKRCHVKDPTATKRVNPHKILKKIHFQRQNTYIHRQERLQQQKIKTKRTMATCCPQGEFRAEKSTMTANALIHSNEYNTVLIYDSFAGKSWFDHAPFLLHFCVILSWWCS